MAAIAGKNPRYQRIRLWALWLLGLASTLVYCLAFTARYPLMKYYAVLGDIGTLSNYRPEAAAAYGLNCVFLFAFYIVSCLLVRDLSPRQSRWPILLPALFFAAAALLTYPITAMDIYYYIVIARVWVLHGANPLAVTPDTFSSDPYLAYAGEYAPHPSPYGPLWMALSAPAGLASAHSLLASLLFLKMVALLAYLACGLLVARVAWHLQPERESFSLMLFLWNPLVVLEAVANGHNDIVMTAFVLLAVAIALSRWRLVSPAILTLAVLVKFPAIVLLPPLFLYLVRIEEGARRKALAAFGSLFLAMALAAAFYAPFWSGEATFAGIARQGGFVGSSPARLLHEATLVLRPEIAPAMARLLLPLCFGAYYLWQLLVAGYQPDKWLEVMANVVFFFAFVIGLFKVWYLLWVIPLAVIANKRRLIVSTAIFSFTALLSVLIYGFVGVWNGWDYRENLVLAIPLVFLPPLLYRLLAREQPPALINVTDGE